MRRLKFRLALAVLVSAVAIGFSVPAAAGAPKCDCWYPNSNTYGLQKNGDCVQSSCWIPI